MRSSRLQSFESVHGNSESNPALKYLYRHGIHILHHQLKTPSDQYARAWFYANKINIRDTKGKDRLDVTGDPAEGDFRNEMQ